jgi:hypothetical protein
MSSIPPPSQQLVLQLDLMGHEGVSAEEAAQFHKTRRAYRACLNCRSRKVWYIKSTGGGIVLMELGSSLFLFEGDLSWQTDVNYRQNVSS